MVPNKEVSLPKELKILLFILWLPVGVPVGVVVLAVGAVFFAGYLLI